MNLYENGEAFVAFVLAFTLTASLRLIEFGYWQTEQLFIGGEPLMATHDAYAWLAGAKGLGAYAESVLSGLIRFIQRMTGLPLGMIGFWLPVFTVPWLALPACLLSRFMRMTEAGVIFAVMSGSSIGFLVRTRLGFCDTDLLTLFCPLAFACSLTAWLVVQTGQGWSRPDRIADPDARIAVGLALLTGAFGALNFVAYAQGGSILLAVLGMAGLLAFSLAPRERLMHVWAAVILVYAFTFGGLPGAVLAFALALAMALRPEYFHKGRCLLILLPVTVLIFFYAGLHSKLVAYFNMVLIYAKMHPAELAGNASVLRLPDVVQSVREAQNVEWLVAMQRIAGHPALFGLGLAGYGFAVFRRPQLLVFLPFLVLGLASVKLGNRFAMYGGVALGVGFGFGMSELMRALGQSQGRRWIAQLALCCVVFWPAGDMMGQMRPAPVLPQVYAQTFADLRDRIEPDARLWQWWDYGYAGQYYAERATFGDGGAHDGTWLYPLARVHSTSSARQARQIMKSVTLAQRMSSTSRNATMYYWSNPVAGLESMGAEAARDYIAGLALLDKEWPEDLPPQYLVVSWENLRLASWISYFGEWDIVTATTTPGRIQQMSGDIRIDSAGGRVSIRGKDLLLDSLDVIDQTGGRNFSWGNGSGNHAVINQLSRQVFLMDTIMYNSMMVQMLIADARSFARDFELVDEKYPWTRVYRAK